MRQGIFILEACVCVCVCVCACPFESSVEITSFVKIIIQTQIHNRFSKSSERSEEL